MNNHTSSLEFSHFPVMMNEVIKISSPATGGKFVDCTFGGGSYSKEILKFSKTYIHAFDRDRKVLPLAKEIEIKFPKRFKFYQKKFSQLDSITDKYVDTVIFDLGLSSIQLDDLNRGFSFKSNKKLNMRMGINEISALDVVNNLGEKELRSIIQILGEEKETFRIAKNIVEHRKRKKIINTNDLVEIIEKNKKNFFFKKINPCTKTFQALRIFVNKEITELITGVINATKKLKPGGKILVVSFHSLEDKIIKYFFTNFSTNKSRPSRYLLKKKMRKKLYLMNIRTKYYYLQKRSKSKLQIQICKLRFAIRSKNKFEYPEELIKRFKKYLDLEATNV